jgi:ferredoxin
MAQKYVYRITRGCVMCGNCVFECRVDAIRDTPEGYVIDEAQCVGCGRCFNNCASEAIERVEIDGREAGDEP